MPKVYFATTNHGFGHVTRTAAIAAELQRQAPDISIIFATTTPLWLLESYIPGAFTYHPRTFDVGVVQADSLQMDKSATVDKLTYFRDCQADIVAAEATFLQENHVDLILGDIPPLLTAIGVAAGVPCWMAGNFGWDFIYRDWGEEFLDIAAWIADLYAQCDRLFRLPCHEPMSSFTEVCDVGWTGGTPKVPVDELRDRFRLDANRPTALLTFGGLSLSDIPYQNLTRFPDWQFIAFDRNAPDMPNLIRVDDRRLRPVDFIPLCDRIVSKPGYSTLAEACRLNVPVVCLTRDGFAEAEMLIAGLRDYNQHLIVTPDEFYTSDWDFLVQSMNSPRKQERLDPSGEVTIAAAILQYLAQKDLM